MTAANERVTVVVITHNRREEILRALEGMSALPDAAPIVVVDNASTDGTVEAITRQYPEVDLVRGSANLGAAARNEGVRRAGTPYVAFCDDDTCWAPGAMTRAAELLDEHPALAGVMAHTLVEPELTDDPLTEELRDSPIPAPDWLERPALMSVLAGTTMFRVSAYHDAGGFSPRLWLGGEEELLCIDLAVRGWWLCWAEEVLVHHAPSQARDARRRRQLGIRNTLWTTWLRRPAGVALRRSADVLTSATKDRHTLSAVGEALAGVPWVLRHRRVVPPHVEARLRLLDAPQRHSRARRYVG